MPTLVTGTIALPDDTAAFDNASVHIRLDSVGMMDAPADTLEDATMTAVAYDGTPLEFTLEGDLGDVTGTFMLWVHVDLSNSGEIDKGDYVTKKTHPVTYENAPTFVEVMVERV